MSLDEIQKMHKDVDESTQLRMNLQRQTMVVRLKCDGGDRDEIETD